MKSVENGVIQRISPSMINTFDAKDNPFGCERRGWFKYVAGIKEPTTEAMTQGTHLHAMNEEYLKTGKLLLGTPEQTAWFKAGLPFLEKMRDSHHKFWCEAPLFDFEILGVKVSEMSKCDFVGTEEDEQMDAFGRDRLFRLGRIVDYKTTKSIEKYGKTPGQLAKDVQMLIYAKAFHPNADFVYLTHAQYQTTEPYIFRESTVELSRAELDDNYARVIIPKVERMKQLVREQEAAAVPANKNACFVGRSNQCPHYGTRCPVNLEGNPLVSILDRFKKKAEVPAAPPAVAEAPKNSVLPPDAPKSDPALAAKPVEGFSPCPPPRKMNFEDVPSTPSPRADLEKSPEPPPTAPATPEAKKAEAPAPSAPPTEEKRKPGRPPGAKNKPKVVDVSPTSENAKEHVSRPALYDEVPVFQFTEVTVNYGATVNVGNFNSLRVDVSITARHDGSDEEGAYQRTLELAKKRVTEECDAIMKRTALDPNKKAT